MESDNIGSAGLDRRRRALLRQVNSSEDREGKGFRVTGDCIWWHWIMTARTLATFA